MFYVYILQSLKDNNFYYGFTEDLKTRLEHHNSGSVNYTKAHRPYKLIWYSAYQNKELAPSFEKYLKSSSGHAFSRKRLIAKQESL